MLDDDTNSCIDKESGPKYKVMCFEAVFPVRGFHVFLWGSGVCQEIEGNLKCQLSENTQAFRFLWR